VDTTFYHPDGRAPGEYGLVVSALVPYKRVDLAIEACRRERMPLKIVGQGPELTRLQRLADSGVEFLGSITGEEIRELYRGARVVLLPGEEDFGIVPLEAQACGRPVIALGRGGACETVRHGVTGLLVSAPAPDAFAAALACARRTAFDPAAIRRHALGFSRERFAAEIGACIDDTLNATDRSSW
jgi:glycosyltransferase involved in cell wall biosynthesis